ncbi:MAG TPA: 2-phospho-L-lactate transferase CofD family protein, partial [Clostridia bacterium]
KASKAPRVYVLNIMTQPGETDGYTLYDHIGALEKHSFKGIVNYCVVNTASIPDDLGKKYYDDGARAVVLDIEKAVKHGVKVIGRDLVGVKNNYIRHEPAKLAEAVISFVD